MHIDGSLALAQSFSRKNERGDSSLRYPHVGVLQEQLTHNDSGRRAEPGLRGSINRHCVELATPAEQQEVTAEHVYIRFGKPYFDLIASAVLLFLTLPLMIIIAIAIKVDSPGSVFFLQERTGYLGRRFHMYKFRTMVRNAEQLKSNILHLNIHAPHSPDFKVKNDPRITRLGNLLRRTSLDELPNLINVLRGEMSLVGPRPTSFHSRTYHEHHLCRLAAKPGVTGLWQIQGRADIDFDERAQLDLRYISTANFWLDLKIIFLTPLRACRGAY